MSIEQKFIKIDLSSNRSRENSPVCARKIVKPRTKSSLIFPGSVQSNQKEKDAPENNATNQPPETTKPFELINEQEFYNNNFCSHLNTALRYCALLSKEILRLICNSVNKVKSLPPKNAPTLEINGKRCELNSIYKPVVSGFINYIIKTTLTRDDIKWIATKRDFIMDKIKETRTDGDDQDVESTFGNNFNINNDGMETEDDSGTQVKIKSIFDLTISDIIKNIDDRHFVNSAFEAIRNMLKAQKQCDKCERIVSCIENTFIDVNSGSLKLDEEEKNKTGEYYVFLMIHLIPEKKNEGCIGISTNPLLAVNLLNLELIPNTKAIRPAVPWWMPELFIGPVADIKTASQLLQSWYDKTRGMFSKRDKGKELACQNGLMYVDKRLQNSMMSVLVKKIDDDETEGRKTHSPIFVLK